MNDFKRAPRHYSKIVESIKKCKLCGHELKSHSSIECCVLYCKCKQGLIEEEEVI